MALTAKQKLHVEDLIRKRRAQLAEELRQDAGKARNEQYAQVAGGAPRDTGDEATADLIADIGQAELSRDLLELRELDHALARLTGHEFGTCIDCSADIDFKRLSAQPTAMRCFDCQRAYEKTFVASRAASL